VGGELGVLSKQVVDGLSLKGLRRERVRTNIWKKELGIKKRMGEGMNLEETQRGDPS